MGGNGQNQTLELKGENGGSTTDLNWLKLFNGNGTTWAFPRTENQLNPCGSRCVRIYAASFQEPQSGTISSKFFNCTVTISPEEKIDPNNPLHRFPDNIASLLAASIALQPSTFRNDQNFSMVQYSSGVVWGNISTQDAVKGADLLGRFAIGAIAVMDILNIKQVGAGDTLGVGVLLVVNWNTTEVLLGVIVAVQTVLSLLVGIPWGRRAVTQVLEWAASKLYGSLDRI
ncbi:hypothetical protein BDD12DRAFT_803136 [Trichophaea hybrida]|nr:hypothetical protein BDD12DRAFT_803136 [Trichophaea hybrida]